MQDCFKPVLRTLFQKVNFFWLCIM